MLDVLGCLEDDLDMLGIRDEKERLQIQEKVIRNNKWGSKVISKIESEIKKKSEKEKEGLYNTLKDVLTALSKYEASRFEEPQGERAVVFIFGLIHGRLGFSDVKFNSPFPDAYGIKDGKRVGIEFETKSRNFILHKHDVTQCDYIVCWKDNWKDCPIKVIELSKIDPIENGLI